MMFPCRRCPMRLGLAERGQTLPLLAMFMVCVLGMTAFAIDAGSWYRAKTHVQADADAAALAAASEIPAGWTSASAAGQQTFTANALSGEALTLTQTTSTAFNVTNDSAQATVTYTAPTYVAKIFGIKTVQVQAQATATIQAQASVFGHVSPYAVLRSNYNNGQGTTLFTANDPNNYGTVDLPTTDNTTGGSCSGNTLMGTSGNVSKVLGDTLAVGTVMTGGCLSPKPGAAQPSATVVNSLSGSISTDLQTLGNGSYQIIPQSWDDTNGLPPRLVFVPIVDSIDPQGNAPMTVTGFAWFYMTAATGGGNGLKITGQYVSISLDCNTTKSSCQTQAYTPGAIGQITIAGLTA